MGYTTTFTGQFKLDRPLELNHRIYLTLFSTVRHVLRCEVKTAQLADAARLAANLPLGHQSCYYVGASKIGVVSDNQPPRDCPNLYCQWTPTPDGTVIIWDGSEKFYDYIPWLKFLIAHFFNLWGYVLNGEVKYQGEDSADFGKIIVVNNKVTKVRPLR